MKAWRREELEKLIQETGSDDILFEILDRGEGLVQDVLYYICPVSEIDEVLNNGIKGSTDNVFQRFYSKISDIDIIRTYCSNQSINNLKEKDSYKYALFKIKTPEQIEFEYFNRIYVSFFITESSISSKEIISHEIFDITDEVQKYIDFHII